MSRHLHLFRVVLCCVLCCLSVSVSAKVAPYAEVKLNEKVEHFDIPELDSHIGQDTLYIKYGEMPSNTSNVFELKCDGKNWWVNDPDSLRFYVGFIYVDPSFSDYSLTTCAYMFSELVSARCISGLQYLNTESVTDMTCMFNKCISLVYLDIENLNTQNVTQMDSMFAFAGLYGPMEGNVAWDFTDFNTQNVTSMKAMFIQTGVTELDLSNFDTRKVRQMDGMFSFCYNLQTIYVGDLWSVDSLDNKDAILFNECRSLKGEAGTKCSGGMYNSSYAHIDGGEEDKGYLSHRKEGELEFYALKADNVLLLRYGIAPENAYKLVSHKKTFSGVSENGIWHTWNSGDKNLEETEISQIIVEPSIKKYLPQSLNSVFGIKTLRVIDGLDYFVTDSVKDMELMFWGCELETIDLSSFHTPSLEIMSEMFSNCEKLKTVYLNNFDTRYVKTMTYMFEKCPNLKTIYVGDRWSTDSILNKKNPIFMDCDSLVGGAGTKWKAGAHGSEYAHIDGGAENPGYLTLGKVFLNGFQFIAADHVKHEVSVGCADITADTIEIPEKVTIAGVEYTVTGIQEGGFKNCIWLKSVKIPASVVTIGREAFYGCSRMVAVTVPSTVTSIGADAFYCVRNVEYYGDSEGAGQGFYPSAKAWGAYTRNGVFDNDQKFIYEDSTYTRITYYFGNDSAVVIPQTVKKIGASAFAGKRELKSVVFNKVKLIESSAFYQTGLEELVLPQCVEEIESYAFRSTTIKRAFIPNSITRMGSLQFYESSIDTVYCEFSSDPKYFDNLWKFGVKEVIYDCRLLSVTVKNSENSTVEVSGHKGVDEKGLYWFTDGSEAKLTAVPADGYEFQKWSIDGGVDSSEVLTLKMTRYSTVDAYFIERIDTSSYVITYMVDDEVFLTDTIAQGDTVIAPAIEPTKEGFTFVEWSELPGLMPAENITVNAIFVELTGVSSDENDATFVWATDGKIFIKVNDAASYCVYDALSRVVAQGEVNDEAQIEMTRKGVCIVDVNGAKYPVIVK